MSKKIFAILLNSFVALLMGSSQLTAAEEKEHVPVESRAMIHAERVALYEEISEQEEKAKEQQESSDEKEEDVVAAAAVRTTHLGAYHHPVSVSAFGDTVELEDGSIWNVSSSDKKKTLNWMTGDVIVITQNNAWFASYDYVLHNLTTGVYVKVNMLLGPYYNGVFTHWASAIDYTARRLYLEDGSIWEIGGTWVSYQSVLNNWLANDTIIIGVNGDASPTTPNLLINVNTNTWVKATCIH